VGKGRARARSVEPAALREALTYGGADSRALRELELMGFTWYAEDLAIARELAGELVEWITPDSVRDLLRAGS
jgi:hypothetical protein